MSEPPLRDLQCLDRRGLHRMAYWQWRDAANPKVLVCVHGLTPQGRDFDALARALCGEYRVVCPDVVGRGRSDWLADAAAYVVPTYVADMVTLLARLDAQVVDWVGTSMGALIGLGLASLDGSPLRRLARCRTLLLRGAESDLMSAATAQAMTQRGPRAQLHQFAGVGHAPTLVQAEQIEVLRRFLFSP